MSHTIRLKPNHEFMLDNLSVVILENYRKTIKDIAFLAGTSQSAVSRKLDALLLMFSNAGIESRFPVIAEKVMPQIKKQKTRRNAA
jgi:hypothetical protein